MTAIPTKEALGFFYRSDFLLPLKTPSRFSPGRLESSVSNLRRALLNLGYRDAQVAVTSTQQDPESGKVQVAVAVEEGPLYEVQSLEIVVLTQAGEEPLRRFIEAFPEKKGISKIPNLVYYDHGYIANPRYYYPFNNKLMSFERDGRFNYAFETTGLPIRVKRGCNQRCSYCVEPFIEGRRYIFRDIDQVIEELKAVSQSHDGIRTVFFVDTEFNLPDLTYCSRLVKRIIEEGLHEHFRFSSQFLPGPFDPEFANLLAKAGFNIIFTCDSFADDVLEKNRVSYRQEDIIMTLKLCEEYGIGCTISMIFGLPGETYETVDQSIGQMKRFPPNFLRRYEYTVGGRIYQGTALSRFIEKEGGKGHLYGVKSEGYLEPYYFCSLESPLGLKEYIEKASDYRIAYDNCYDEIRFRTLAIGYLADQGKWEEATSLFFKSDLSVQSSIYQYLFQKLTGAGRAKDAKLVSENLLLVIQDNGASSRYSDQTDLIRFYLSCLR